MNSLALKLTVLCTLSLFGMNAFAQTPTAADADSGSSGSRGDGYSLLGQFSGGGQPIQVPTFSEDQIKDQIEKLRQTKPDSSIKYESLFDPKDQDAFDDLQAQILLRIDASVKAIAHVKQLYTEGLVVYDHFLNKEYSDVKAHNRQLGSVAESYRSVMKEEYEKVLNNLNPTFSISDYSLPYAFRKNASGKIVDLAYFHWENSVTVATTILGTADFTGCTYDSQNGTLSNCGDWKAGNGDLETVAKKCKKSVCADEIGSVAQEMLADSIGLYEKVRFQDSDADHLSFFIDAKNSMMRYALSNFIDDMTANKAANAPLVAILGLTNLAYIPTLSLVDAVINFTSFKTTLNFKPDTWSDGSTRRQAPGILMDAFTGIEKDKLKEALSGR